MPPLIELMNVTKTYTSGARAVTALHALSLNVADGEFVGLANDPALLLADEPTGNLDSNSGAEVLGFLRRSVDEFGQSIVMVTHDAKAASYADRVIFLADGRIVGDLRSPTAEAILEQMKHLDVIAAGN